MAQVVMAAEAAGAVTQTAVGMAEAAARIADIVRDQAAKNRETMRNEDNEFNIRKNFLDNAVNAIKEATYSQYNIVVCTDQEHDDFQNLSGQILPMDLLNLEVAPGKNVNFQVYVFDTGKYLRHGKWERDFWWWWGENKKWTDPAAMHVHFENAQKKLDAGQVKAEQEKKAKEEEEAAKVKAAEKTSQDATELKKKFDAVQSQQSPGQGRGVGDASDTSQAQVDPQLRLGLPDGEQGYRYAAEAYDAAQQGGAVPYAETQQVAYRANSSPAPDFTDHMMGLVGGQAMRMFTSPGVLPR